MSGHCVIADVDAGHRRAGTSEKEGESHHGGQQTGDAALPQKPKHTKVSNFGGHPTEYEA